MSNADKTLMLALVTTWLQSALERKLGPEFTCLGVATDDKLRKSMISLVGESSFLITIEELE